MIFRCTSTWTVPTYTSSTARMRILQELTCEGHRWHRGWHFATWTWWPTQTGQPAESHKVEWSGVVPFETFDLHTDQEPYTGVTTAEAAEGLRRVAEAGPKIGPDHPFEREPFDDETAAVGPAAEASIPTPMITVEEPEPTPLMKAHLALLRYGRHEQMCPWAYPPIDLTQCLCGLAEAIESSCPAPEGEHG